MTADLRWGRKTRQDSLEAGCEIILDAAKTCYQEKGIGSTSIDDIANAAKVNRRTIYRYFDNKKAIIQAVVDEQVVDFFATVSSELDGLQDDFPSFLKGFISQLVLKGPLDPSHTLFLGSKNAEIAKQYYFSSTVTPELIEELMGPSYDQAISKKQISEEFSYEELMLWVSRQIFSYIEFPVSAKELERDIDTFILSCLRRT